LTMFTKLVWPGVRLMMPPLAWLSWFPAVAIMLAGTGLILHAFLRPAVSNIVRYCRRVSGNRDPAKSERNARERGLPFDIAMALFDGPTIEVDDQRRDYGEHRIIAYGNVAARVLVCVYTCAALRTTQSDGSSVCAKQTRVRVMPTKTSSRSELDLAKVDWRRVDATTYEDIERT
jgi:uncharacterized DUF497 family protein